MAELFFFRPEIVFGRFAGGDQAGDPLHHVDAGSLERLDLFGVVGHETHRF